MTTPNPSGPSRRRSPRAATGEEAALGAGEKVEGVPAVAAPAAAGGGGNGRWESGHG